MSATLIIDPKTDSVTLIRGTDVKHETIYSSQRSGFEWSELIETLGNELLEHPEYSSWSSGPWTLTTSPKEIEKGEIVNGKKIILENRATYTKTTDECVHVFLSGETFVVKVDSVSMEGKQSLLINDNDPDEAFNLGEILTAVAKLLRQNGMVVSGDWEAQFSFDEKEWEYRAQLRAAVMPDFMEKDTNFYEPSPAASSHAEPSPSIKVMPSPPTNPYHRENELTEQQLRNKEINKFGCMYAVLGFLAGVLFAATSCTPEPEQIETIVTETVTPEPSTVTTTKTTIKIKTAPAPSPVQEPEPIEQVIEEPAPIANLAPIPEPAPAPEPVQPAPPPDPAAPAQSVYYANCTAARAAGAAPLYAGTPGYRSQLDRDGDGVACE